EQSLGRPLARVDAGGDLTVRLPLVTGRLAAGGRLVVDGKVEAEHLSGRAVHVGAGPVPAKAISATERIVIGAARLTVDVIIAPEIVIDPSATGRVTVIESRNERGPAKIKGGFSLKEYEELFGDATDFLAAREVAPLDGAPASEVDPLAHEPVGEESEAFVVESADAELDGDPPTSDEEVDDPLSLSVEDLEPVDDELHPRLVEALDRITSCYEGHDLPPAVTDLRGLVDRRDYPQLRERITEVWNGLLGFHQQRGIRPHHQVTHAFNVIHGLVQEG